MLQRTCLAFHPCRASSGGAPHADGSSRRQRGKGIDEPRSGAEIGARGLSSSNAPEAPTALRLHVELVHDPGCPHVPAARDLLTSVLREIGVPAVWTEWSTGDDRCPAYARGLGSPTILINGEDVAPGPHPWGAEGEATAAACCRLYRQPDGAMLGVPPRSLVSRAVRGALEPDAG